MKKKKIEQSEILKHSFDLIGKYGWKNFSLLKLSNYLDLDLEIIKKFLKSKSQFLMIFSESIDEEVMQSVDIEDLKENSVRDNLFELIMLRYEKLLPYKSNLKVLLNDLKSSPVELKRVSKKIMNSLDLYLEISNAKNNFLYDLVKLNSIFLIYTFTFKTWMNDDSQDMSATMAELDKWLSKAEYYSEKINLFQ